MQVSESRYTNRFNTHLAFTGTRTAITIALLVFNLDVMDFSSLFRRFYYALPAFYLQANLPPCYLLLLWDHFQAMQLIVWEIDSLTKAGYSGWSSLAALIEIVLVDSALWRFV